MILAAVCAAVFVVSAAVPVIMVKEPAQEEEPGYAGAVVVAAAEEEQSGRIDSLDVGIRLSEYSETAPGSVEVQHCAGKDLAHAMGAAPVRHPRGIVSIGHLEGQPRWRSGSLDRVGATGSADEACHLEKCVWSVIELGVS